jgi:hypothetical protein
MLDLLCPRYLSRLCLLAFRILVLKLEEQILAIIVQFLSSSVEFCIAISMFTVRCAFAVFSELN